MFGINIIIFTGFYIEITEIKIKKDIVKVS